MSQMTANLALPLIAAGQAGKHVTHNEALAALDTLVQLACLDKDLTSPALLAHRGRPLPRRRRCAHRRLDRPLRPHRPFP